jgi:hypothetical protein
MHKLILGAMLSVICVSANARLYMSQVCDPVDETKCRKAFLFVDNKPTKTLSGTVSKLLECEDIPVLTLDEDAGKDRCLSVILSYINTETGLTETYFYKNGATSSDGVTWDREQNPGCPPM